MLFRSTVRALRDEGKRVLLHCVEGRSRTPTVAARYAQLLGEDPFDLFRREPWMRPRPELLRAVLDGPWTARKDDLARLQRVEQATLRSAGPLTVTARWLPGRALRFVRHELRAGFGDVDDDYREYWATVAREDVPTLARALGADPTDDLLTVLVQHGREISAESEAEWLQARGIPFERM